MSGTMNAVTVLTRFHTLERLHLLDEALFSLLGQNGVRVCSRILCQSLGDDAFARVVEMCRVYEQLGLDVLATNEHFDADGDHRSELLNCGMARLETRYLAFLDCDDVVYPSCYVRLIERIVSTGAALAFTGVNSCEYFLEAGSVFVKSKSLSFGNAPRAQFFIQNQYPIHSFVIDATRIDPADFRFDPGVARNEDYAFLFRLLRKYKFDTKEYNRANCEYRLNMDGDNTVTVFGATCESMKGWREAEKYMDRVRSEQPIVIDFEDLTDLLQHCSDRAAKEAQNRLAEEEGRIAHYALVRRIASPRNGRLRYHLDRIIKRADGDYIVDGWCAGGTHRPLALVIFNASKEACGFHASFNGREDVARMLKSDELTFGFSVPVKGAASVGLIALCSDGNIYQSDVVSLTGDRPAGAPRPGLARSRGLTFRRRLPA